jgi:hypothetical protein
MKVVALLHRRLILAVDAFVEISVWRVPQPVTPSIHSFKYRLAYIVEGECVLRYDNERGKGNHLHIGGEEMPYEFSTPGQLMLDFEAAKARWNDEHGRA